MFICKVEVQFELAILIFTRSSGPIRYSHIKWSILDLRLQFSKT